MPQYIVELIHPPNTCPSSNKAVRELAIKGFGQMPALGQKYQVKPQGIYHLDPEHRTIALVEASNVESVRDMLYEAGMMSWNDGRVYPVTPVEELMKRIDQFPLVF
jgi:hypothetical protein